MDPLVPSYVSIGGVTFPLFANSAGLVSVCARNNESDEMVNALGAAVSHMVGGAARDVPLAQLARDGFRVQGLWAEPIPDRSLGQVLDGPINWERLSGRWPDIASSFVIQADFSRRALVIPRDILFALVAQLRELRADVLAGRREGRVDTTPVPPLPPMTPEVAEYEAQLAFSREDAWEYLKGVYARRG